MKTDFRRMTMFPRFPANCGKHRIAEALATSTWGTLCGLGLVFCALLMLVSAVLTLHQMYWMSKSSDPWMVSATRERFLILPVTTALQTEAESQQWNTAKTQAGFWRIPSSKSEVPGWETVHPIWVEKDRQTLKAIVLIPRQSLLRSRAQFAVLQPGTRYATHPLAELPRVLSSLGLEAGEGTLERRPALLP